MIDALSKIIPRFKIYDDMFIQLGNRGYTIALNIRNVTPEYYHSTFPDEWVDEYTTEGYVFCDPVIQFLATSSGAKRWSEVKSLPIPGKTKKFKASAERFGLKYGLAVAKTNNTGKKFRHLLSIARDDREFEEAELREAAAMFEALLAQIDPKQHLSERMLMILAEFAQGGSAASAAKVVHVSEATVKKDMEAARGILSAKTITEAVAVAMSRRLIGSDAYPKW